MKNLIVFLGLIGLAITIISAVPAKENSRSYAYCEMIVTPRAFSNKVTISVDFGQAARTFADTRVRDEETGKFKRFNSTMDAMNYLGCQGWELVDANDFGDAGTQARRSFVFMIPID